MAEWNFETLHVTFVKDGQNHVRDFPANTSVSAAVETVSREFHLASAVIKDADGNEISPSDGDRLLNEVGNLTMYQKAALGQE
jgi:hypothetical protein